MYGKIIDILIQSKCSNPVIFFDELDKVSQTDKGTDIIGILTHLTDTTQNNQFHDKYFSEFDFDLSKCLFIFSYNNEEFVNPILKDRMYTIDISGYTIKEKIKIALNYLLPEIIKEYNMEGIIFTETIIEYIIENTEKEQGVRCLKRSLETICSKLNLKRILENYIYTQELTIEAIQDMLNIKEKEQTSYINMYL
jgi:ATP-dependent Lon protease